MNTIHRLIVIAIVTLGVTLPAGAQDMIFYRDGGAMIVGGNYASMMRQRARRDSVLEKMRGGKFTEEHVRTAYRDATARKMVDGARQGRFRQDSALHSYDANGYEFYSVGAKIGENGRERLVQRTEAAARIRWQRDKGAVIDAQGVRTASGLFAGTDIEKEMARGEKGELRRGQVSVPYYPGREELWLGGTAFGFSSNSPILLHPFAPEAEAYYNYAAGDSAQIVLPDGKSISLRELRITPRKAHWTLVVGSFWFDESDFRLVRASYRPSELVDAWEYGEWTEGGWNESELKAKAALGVLLAPFRATVSSITIEYGLYESRFWLPRQQTATGEIRVNFARLPVEIVEKFEYTTVNGPESVPDFQLSASYALGDSLWVLDSLGYHGDTVARRLSREMRLRASTQQRERAAVARRADSARSQVPFDTARARQEIADMRFRIASNGCSSDSGSTSQVSRNRNRGLVLLVRMPCNDSLLANSPYLPAAAAVNSADALQTTAMLEMIQRLDMGLQAGWGFRLPKLRYGFGDSLTRYNRIEGLSPAMGVREVVGRGFAFDALGRIGTASGIFEGEISLTRSNVRQNLQLTAYRRLNSVSDWGDPFTLGASLQALFFGRDEGFYYRSRGVAFSASTPGNPNLEMKVFVESQMSAHQEASFSLAHSFGGAPFGNNIDAEPGRIFGTALTFSHAIGLDPARFRMFTRIRAENAIGDFSFGRGLIDVNLQQGLFRIASASLTLSAGSSMGDVPQQRMFILGGSHTIRGQRAGVASGDAFWMGRLEIGTAASVAKPVVFTDFGWAGSRETWRTPGRPLSGVGVGASFLDGMIRLDLARGLYPSHRVRFAMYLDARL